MGSLDLLSLIPAGAMAGLFGWVGNAWLQKSKAKGDTRTAEINADAALERHRDGLTFQLLDAARVELAEMKREVNVLRPLEAHLFHLQQALEHIEALLSSDPGERAVAERNARAFLARMRGFEAAKGQVLNEAQRLRSAQHLGLSPGDVSKIEGEAEPPPFNTHE